MKNNHTLINIEDIQVSSMGKNNVDYAEMKVIRPQKSNIKPKITEVNFNDPNEEDDDVIPDDLEIPDSIFNQKKITRHMSKKDIIKERVKTLKKISTGVKNYDPENNISIRHFDDTRPQKDKIYFKPSKFYGKEANGIAVIIPFFNEHPETIIETLNSLINTWNHLRVGSEKWRNSVLYICLVQDGWNKASASMKEYLKYLFPKKIKSSKGEEKYWWDYYKDFSCTEEEQAKMPDRTFIFQKKNYGNVAINPFLKDNDKYLKISLVIKTKNRRKHNSHEWFLGHNGFAEAVNAEYLLLTDAFAMYNNWLLYHLAKKLDKNPDMVAVTGRQRLMSRAQQGSNVGTFSLGNMISLVQLYDFESSNVIYNGAFSLGGLLPVIPGPCGLYRASNLLSNSVRNYYFDTVNKDPDQTGMVLGNLRIAEDRVLSYAAVIKSENPKAYMQFHPLAIFYFEAETDLSNLIFQRRRWINGSVAGYLYLLFFNFTNDLLKWKAGTLRKIYVWILLMCQFFTYMMVALAPSISLGILYEGINYFQQYYNFSTNFNIIYIGVILWAIYFAHLFYHHSRSKFNYVIMYILLLVSFATSIISMAALFHYAFVLQQMTLPDIVMSGNIIVYLGLYVFFGPFIVSLMLSGRGHSFLFMLKSFVSYYLFLPMLIAWFGSYSYARTWDLSWGNRPASEMDAVSAQKKDEVMKNFKTMSLKIVIVIFIMNISLYFIPLQGKLILMSIFFVLSAYQLTLSIIFCLINIFYKIGFIFKKIRIAVTKVNITDNDPISMNV